MGHPLQDPFALVGSTLDGRFVIDRVVARGGFGVVYQAWHTRLLRPVAIKALVYPSYYSPAMCETALGAFEQEARLLAHLDHPAFVRVYDTGESVSPNGVAFEWTALEWIHGESLDDLLKRRCGRPMSPAEALAIVRPVLGALAYAHALGIAHRDVKPANVMIPEPSLTGREEPQGARLIDFGSARFVGEEEPTDIQSQLTFPAFTVLYAAPEQVYGLKTGPWTDVHAVALILCEMLTGSRAYRGCNRRQIEFSATCPDRPTPGRAGVDVGAWETVLERALTQRASERYVDAAEFLAALEATVVDAKALRFDRGAVDETADTGERPSGVIVAFPREAPTVTPRKAPRRTLALALFAFIAVNLMVGAVLRWRHFTRAAVSGALWQPLRADEGALTAASRGPSRPAPRP
jgi:serine/threonine protein kinase